MLPSLEMVIWVAVGGRGSLAGAVLGAVSVNYGRSVLTNYFPELWPFILGGLFVLVVLLFPDGLVGMIRKGKSLLSQRKAGEENRLCRMGKPLCRRGSAKMAERVLIIHLEGVTVDYDGFKALNNLNFIVDYNELRVVIGPNGAGKTTLARCHLREDQAGQRPCLFRQGRGSDRETRR